MKLIINVDNSDFLDQATVENLKEIYKTNKEEVRRLEAYESLKPFQQEDLRDCKMIRFCAKKLIRYILNEEDFKKFECEMAEW